MSLTQLRNLGIVANAGIATTKLGAGAIIQVSNLITATQAQTIATATYTDLTSMSLSITPSSASNKILLISYVSANLGDSEGFGLAYVRNSTIIAYTGDANDNFSFYHNAGGPIYSAIPFIYIDSPSSTSSITYKIQASTYLSSSIQFNDSGSYYPTFFAMEIAG